MGLELPDEARNALKDVQKRLQAGCRFVDAHPKWAPAENFHLTLAFLGDIRADRVMRIIDAMDQVVADQPAFELETKRIELFPPDAKPPRVISAAIGGEKRRLRDLHASLVDKIWRAGFDVDHRSFSPHITIARLPSTKTAARVAPLVVSHSAAGMVKFPVKQVVLFESMSAEAGVYYEPLHRADLQMSV